MSCQCITPTTLRCPLDAPSNSFHQTYNFKWQLITISCDQNKSIRFGTHHIAFILTCLIHGNLGMKGLDFSDLVRVQEVKRRWEINVDTVNKDPYSMNNIHFPWTLRPWCKAIPFPIGGLFWPKMGNEKSFPIFFPIFKKRDGKKDGKNHWKKHGKSFHNHPQLCDVYVKNI